MTTPPFALENLRRRHAEVVREHGPWTAHNIHLQGPVWTIGSRIDAHAAKLRAVTQVVADLARAPLHDLRVLDLGCLEGQYAIEFASQGASVVAVDVREGNLAKARFVRDHFGLDNLELRLDDVRNLSEAGYGRFDVVLCLGLLYHLDAPDVMALIDAMAAICDRVLVVQTQVSLRPARAIRHRENVYRGSRMIEPDLGHPFAALGNRHRFVLTEASLCNALGDAGFTSVLSMRRPRAALTFRDFASLAAVRGERMQILGAPPVNHIRDVVPERPLQAVHPSQRPVRRLLWPVLWPLLTRVRRLRERRRPR
jgi:SAM-dependent methyltransferase